MKKLIIFGSLLGLLITACTGSASSTMSKELYESYGAVQVFAAPT